jgi:hypothetical protein
MSCNEIRHDNVMLPIISVFILLNNKLDNKKFPIRVIKK